MVAAKGCQNVNYFQWFLDFLCVPHLRLYCYFDYSASPCAIIHVSHVQEGLAGRKLICCQHGNFWYDAERLSFKAVDWEMSNLYTGTQGASFRSFSIP